MAFAQVRPSPWRQAVDLANMMLVLAVRTDAERVYERALQFFTPDEIAEAFAATRGVASPTQLRSVMKQDGRDLVAQFRALAPARRPISLQRWSVRRVVYAARRSSSAPPRRAGDVRPVRARRADVVAGTPTCGTDNLMVLMAQSVPTATSVPCIASLPAGWELGGVQRPSGTRPLLARLRRAGDQSRRGDAAAAARLLRSTSASEVPSDEVGHARASSSPSGSRPTCASTRYYLVRGRLRHLRFAFERATPTPR